MRNNRKTDPEKNVSPPPDSDAPAADAWGIEAGYTDADDRWRESPETLRTALRNIMGPLENLDETLGAEGDGKIPVPVQPCPWPSRKAWGWAVQLYAVRSAQSWGIGDLADLRRLGEWASRLGAGFIQVNPLMAGQPLPPVEASPYYPSSRRFMSPLYLRIEDVPGADDAAVELAPLADRGRSLNRSTLIDRDAVLRLKREALELLWRPDRMADPGYARFVLESGSGLRQFAVYCVLAEAMGPDWKTWPREFQHPDSPAITRFAGERAAAVDFHIWMQWLLDSQLERAAAAISIVQDLPIGFDPGGADAWAWQDLLAFGASVGAPPDRFNREGQDWGLPPFIPHRLRKARYRPLEETFRAVLRHAKGLRIDHVMGLFRLFWIPKGSKASDGTYVRFSHEDVLAAVAAECRRAGAFAIGEDLGTVEPLVRRILPEWGVLGSKVLWFESDPPSAFPPATLATITTHDLPTLSGRLRGFDDEEQRGLGLPVDPDGGRVSERVLAWAGVAADAEPGAVTVSVHRMLARSPSILVAATLEDALGVERRPNLPGTLHERPNWKIPLPKTLEEIEVDPLVLEVAAALDRQQV